MAPTESHPSVEPPLRIGALAPLTPPGWAGAGRHLVAGLELAVRHVNETGGVDGRSLELLVRDTAADPSRAIAAVDELDALGVAALAGEYHSVVARTVAIRADELGMPYLCSSAVLDALTDGPTDLVARLAPPQSRGWRIFADHLIASGRSRIAVVSQPSIYWSTGTSVLRHHLEPLGASVVELAVGAHGTGAPDLPALCHSLVEARATAVLLLVGHPEPAMAIVAALRRDPRLADALIAAPAGQPEFAEWATRLGADGAGIPFLRYLTDRPGALAERVGTQLREQLGGQPSFVAFEGYDTGLVLAEVLRAGGGDRSRVAGCWPHVEVVGTRGLITFTRVPGVGVWQWASPPIQVVDRDPREPERFRVLSEH